MQCTQRSFRRITRKLLGRSLLPSARVLERCLMISRLMLDGLFSSYSADIWSIGVSLYILIYGRLPIRFSNLMDYMVKMKNYNSLPPLDGISSELKQLLTSLLNPDVSLRPTIKGILVNCFSERS